MRAELIIIDKDIYEFVVKNNNYCIIICSFDGDVNKSPSRPLYFYWTKASLNSKDYDIYFLLIQRNYLEICVFFIAVKGYLFI